MTNEQLQSIQKQLEKMDSSFWNDKIKRMTMAKEHFQLVPGPATELAAEKAVLDFEVAEIRYNGYVAILEWPEKVAEITGKVKAEIEEKQNILKTLGG